MVGETAPLIDPGRVLGISPAFGPDQLLDTVAGLLHGLAERAVQSFSTITEYYVFWTGNFNDHGGAAGPCLHAFAAGQGSMPGCRFTDNAALRAFYGLTESMAIALLVVLVSYALARSMFEHSFHGRYTLKAMLPRLMLVTILITFGLGLLQQAVDLNNAAVDTIWGFHPGLPVADSNIWRLVQGGEVGNAVLGVMFFLVAVLLVILLVTSVARNLLLVILVAGAPLAFLCMLLPELDSYAVSWRRLFLTAVFTQVVQVMVLRLALLLMFDDHGVLSAIHGLVTLYIALRVPTALHAASHAESKLMLYAKHASHGAVKAFEHAVAPAHHTRAHSVAH